MTPSSWDGKETESPGPVLSRARDKLHHIRAKGDMAVSPSPKTRFLTWGCVQALVTLVCRVGESRACPPLATPILLRARVKAEEGVSKA